MNSLYGSLEDMMREARVIRSDMVAREAVKQLSADGVIPDLLAEHCKSAACSARDTVLQALDECREDAEEFAEEVQQRAEQKATGKRGSKKR